MPNRKEAARRGPFLMRARLSDDAPDGLYPFDLPAVRGLHRVTFGAVTILVGDNGTGKSTVEALAIASGFNAEGGGRNLQFATHRTHSEPSADLCNETSRPDVFVGGCDKN